MWKLLVGQGKFPQRLEANNFDEFEGEWKGEP